MGSSLTDADQEPMKVGLFVFYYERVPFLPTQ